MIVHLYNLSFIWFIVLVAMIIGFTVKNEHRLYYSILDEGKRNARNYIHVVTLINQLLNQYRSEQIVSE